MDAEYKNIWSHVLLGDHRLAIDTTQGLAHKKYQMGIAIVCK